MTEELEPKPSKDKLSKEEQERAERGCQSLIAILVYGAGRITGTIAAVSATPVKIGLDAIFFAWCYSSFHAVR